MEIIGHRRRNADGTQPASTRALLLACRPCRRTGPKADHLTVAFRHHACCLSFAFSRRSATGRIQNGIGPAQPHAHKRVLLEPRVCHFRYLKDNVKKNDGSKSAAVVTASASEGRWPYRSLTLLARRVNATRLLGRHNPALTSVYEDVGEQISMAPVRESSASDFRLRR